ncbi:MAG TPA: oligosaccharide flippase family protein [Lachnospiraceae bacterium]|nr:oligosaccharide flippase family protein [Lachnospiraceae bacterium]
MIKIIKKTRDRYSNLPVGVKAAMWFTFCSFLQQAISLLTTPVFTRLMTTDEYGVWTVYGSWRSTLGVFITLQLAAGGFGKAMLKFKNRYAYVSSMICLTFVSVGAWSVVLFLGRNVFPELLELRLPYLFSMLVSLFFQQVFSLWAGKQRFEYQYKRLVAITAIATVLTPMFSIVAIQAGANTVDARVYGQAIVNAVCYGGIMIVILVKGRCFYNREYWKYSFPFGLAMIPHYLANSVLSSSDRIMIGQMVGSTESALYNIGYSIANIMVLFLTSVLSAFSPWMMIRIDQKNFQNVKYITNMLGVCFCTLSLLPILAGPEVISILATHEYSQSVWVIPPVAGSIYFIYIHNLFSCVQFFYEKKTFIVVASCSAAAVNVLLNYIFIGLFGYVAAAYTTLFCYMALSVVDFIFLQKIRKKYEIEDKIYDYKMLFLLSIVVVMISVGGNLLYLNRVVRYALLAAVLIIMIVKRKQIISLYKRLKER